VSDTKQVEYIGKADDKCQVCGALAIYVWSGDQSRRCFEHMTDEAREVIKANDPMLYDSYRDQYERKQALPEGEVR
jgi:hypothetical protein